jgi:hypothetical protein
MKNLNLLTILAAVFVLSSCTKDNCTTKMTYVKYEPIYKSYDEIRQPISVGTARAIKNPGKIYLYHNYILINEQLEGLHVIDNNDPANPQNIAFINIQGNLDMSMKGNILYADSYIDLLTIDMTNPMAATIVDRDNDVFPDYGMDENGLICVAYRSSEVTEDVVCGQNVGGWGNPGMMEDNQPIAMAQTGGNTNFTSSASGAGRSGDASVGTGGSMARFTINGDYLYTVSTNDLHVFNIGNLLNPIEQGTINVGWAAVETIFPYQNNLFIGSNAGLFIYDVSVPNNPIFVSEFSHATACDPVYVSGDRAYVTLRGGTDCENFNNQLDVIDISNINNPRLVKTHPMFNPHGLSIKDGKLYLCDGAEGLKVFDATDDMKIGSSLLASDNSITTFDVIANPYRDLLLVIGKDGFFQYDITNPASMTRISSIPVVK